MLYIKDVTKSEFEDTVQISINGVDTECLPMGGGLLMRCDDARDLVNEVRCLMIEQHNYDSILSMDVPNKQLLLFWHYAMHAFKCKLLINVLLLIIFADRKGTQKTKELDEQEKVFLAARMRVHRRLRVSLWPGESWACISSLVGSKRSLTDFHSLRIRNGMGKCSEEASRHDIQFMNV
jgi:hypothetical protein